MASLHSTLCGVCASQHVTTDATFWCPECDEGLCSTCLKYHNAVKSSRNHEVIPVDNYRQLPSFVASVQQYCSDHDKKYQLYCLQHESPCCPHCVTTTHKTCNLTALDEIVKTSKTSALFDNLEQSLEDLKGNLKRIIDDREKNVSKVQQSREKIQSEIKTMRDKINKQLDSIEQKILQDLGDVEKGVNSELRFIQTKLLDHTKTVEELQTNFSAIKKYASELQAFVGMKKIETDIEHEEKFIESLLEDDSLQQVDIVFKENQKLTDIFSIADYGKISRIASSQIVAVKLEKNKQAQFLVKPSVEKKRINDINLSLHRKLKIPELNILSMFTGCTITPTGKIVLVDWNHHNVFILSENESLECKINVSNQPVDVTCIDDKTIAITFNYTYGPYKIETINISSKQKEKEIETSNCCYGITNEQGRLVFYSLGKGIQSVDFSGKDHSTIVKEPKMSDWNYVTVSGGKLYHTNRSTDTVTCYTITGEQIWEYSDKSFLKNICGVTTDKDANVYVASYGNHSIVVISQDGKHARRLIGREDGLSQPWGIYLDKTRNNLLIACYNGDVHMYKVS
ncbi:E3 ubiquitin-protein ligase TRIM71-like [Mytilus trossulus]|uniref:E3 ubiquitin-protein ligase TRIM71-like n=1 Tax=Mytilus trossulus TaxID=6551 RepID=UPI00300707BA